MEGWVQGVCECGVVAGVCDVPAGGEGAAAADVRGVLRDLEKFAEFVEGWDATLMTARQEHVCGVYAGICGSMGWSRGRWRGS